MIEICKNKYRLVQICTGFNKEFHYYFVNYGLLINQKIYRLQLYKSWFINNNNNEIKTIFDCIGPEIYPKPDTYTILENIKIIIPPNIININSEDDRSIIKRMRYKIPKFSSGFFYLKTSCTYYSPAINEYLSLLYIYYDENKDIQILELDYSDDKGAFWVALDSPKASLIRSESGLIKIGKILI